MTAEPDRPFPIGSLLDGGYACSPEFGEHHRTLTFARRIENRKSADIRRLRDRRYLRRIGVADPPMSGLEHVFLVLLEGAVDGISVISLPMPMTPADARALAADLLAAADRLDLAREPGSATE